MYTLSRETTVKNILPSFWRRVYFKRIWPFIEGPWFAEKQTRSYKSCLYEKVNQIPIDRLNMALIVLTAQLIYEPTHFKFRFKDFRPYITKTRLFKYVENFTTKNWKFSDKNSNIFHISAQNIDCRYSLEPPRRGGSNEYPQSMFLSRNKKNNVYPCKPQFYCIKVGFKGVNII